MSNAQKFTNEGNHDLRLVSEGWCKWSDRIDGKFTNPKNASWQARAYREGMAQYVKDEPASVLVETTDAGSFWRAGASGKVIAIDAALGLAYVDFGYCPITRRACEPHSRFVKRPTASAIMIGGEAKWWVPLNALNIDHGF